MLRDKRPAIWMALLFFGRRCRFAFLPSIRQRCSPRERYAGSAWIEKRRTRSIIRSIKSLFLFPPANRVGRVWKGVVVEDLVPGWERYFCFFSIGLSLSASWEKILRLLREWTPPFPSVRGTVKTTALRIYIFRETSHSLRVNQLDPWNLSVSTSAEKFTNFHPSIRYWWNSSVKSI